MMKPTNKLLSITALFVVAAAFGSYALYANASKVPAASSLHTFATTTESALILYVGDGCPHCANVETYLKTHLETATLDITQKEVYHNQQNASELIERAKSCGLQGDSVGIPFLSDGSRCIVGDTDIIAFLASTTARK